MIFRVFSLVYFALSNLCAQNNVLSKTYILYKQDKLIPGHYRQVQNTRLQCSILCFTNNSCAGFGYHKTRLECFLYDRYPVECQGVVNDTGMKIYVSAEEDKTNVAIGKPTAMSSFYRLPFLPCNCVDGNTADDGTALCHTKKLNPNWFCVDLQNIYNFKQILIFNREGGSIMNRIVNFQLRLSSTGACDESNFSTAPLCYQDPNTSGQLVYNITTCSTAIAFSSRYVFISNNGQFLHFCEVKVHA